MKIILLEKFEKQKHGVHCIVLHCIDIHALEDSQRR